MDGGAYGMWTTFNRTIVELKFSGMDAGHDEEGNF